jgi:anti-sigma-K factor RskA
VLWKQESFVVLCSLRIEFFRILLEEQEAIFNAGAAPDFARLASLEKKLVAEAQILLKQEWKRVRSGELAYRMARIAAALVVATAIVLALLWGYGHIFATP